MKEMTTAEQLAEIDADAARKKAEIVKAETLVSLLPDWAKEYKHGSPHWYKLYGREVSLKWERERYSSLDTGKKSPDLAFIDRMMKEYPPLPVMLVKDSCTSFRLATAAPEDTERVSLTAVAPFVIEIRPEDREATFVWSAQIGPFVVELNVVIPLPQNLGRLDIVVKRYADGDISRIERCDFEPKPAGARRIKWASGSHKTLSRFTVYWESADYTFAELLESLA